MTIDEIIAKLETRRDHGPYLHELVYQLACTFRENLQVCRDSVACSNPSQEASISSTDSVTCSNPSREAPISATGPSIRLTFELSQEPELPDQWVGRCVELDVISAGMSPLRTLEATAEAVRMIVENYRDSVNSCLRQGSLTVVAAIAALAEITSR